MAESIVLKTQGQEKEAEKIGLDAGVLSADSKLVEGGWLIDRSNRNSVSSVNCGATSKLTEQGPAILASRITKQYNGGVRTAAEINSELCRQLAVTCQQDGLSRLIQDQLLKLPDALKETPQARKLTKELFATENSLLKALSELDGKGSPTPTSEKHIALDKSRQTTPDLKAAERIERNALDLFKKGAYQEALTSFFSAYRFADAPGRHRIEYQIGCTFIKLGECREAISFLRSAAADPQIAHSALYNLGVAHWRLEDRVRAMVCFSKAVATDPSDKDPSYNFQVSAKKVLSSTTWIDPKAHANEAMKQLQRLEELATETSTTVGLGGQTTAAQAFLNAAFRKASAKENESLNPEELRRKIAELKKQLSASRQELGQMRDSTRKEFNALQGTPLNDPSILAPNPELNKPNIFPAQNLNSAGTAGTGWGSLSITTQANTPTANTDASRDKGQEFRLQPGGTGYFFAGAYATYDPIKSQWPPAALKLDPVLPQVLSQAGGRSISTTVDTQLIELVTQAGLAPDPQSIRFNCEGVGCRLLKAPRSGYYLQVQLPQDLPHEPVRVTYELKPEIEKKPLFLPDQSDRAEIASELNPKSAALIKKLESLKLPLVQKGQFLAEYIAAHGTYEKDNPERISRIEEGTGLQQLKVQEAVFWQDPQCKDWGMKCDHYAKFYVALARKLGLQARVECGYLNDSDNYLQKHERHAWPQIWDASKNTWIDVDPTARRRPGEALPEVAKKQDKYLELMLGHSQEEVRLEKLEIRLDQTGHPLFNEYLYLEQVLSPSSAWTAAYRKAVQEANVAEAIGESEAPVALRQSQTAGKRMIERTVDEALASTANQGSFWATRLRLGLGMLETMMTQQSKPEETEWQCRMLERYETALKKFAAPDELGYTVAESAEAQVFVTRNGDVYKRGIGEFTFEKLAIDLSAYDRIGPGRLSPKGDLLFAAERNGAWDIIKNDKVAFQVTQCPEELLLSSNGDVYAICWQPPDKQALVVNGKEIANCRSITPHLSSNEEHLLFGLNEPDHATLYKDGRIEPALSSSTYYIFNDGSMGERTFDNKFYLNKHLALENVESLSQYPAEDGNSMTGRILVSRPNSTNEVYELQSGSLKLLKSIRSSDLTKMPDGTYSLVVDGITKAQFKSTSLTSETSRGLIVTGQNLRGEKILYSNGIETPIPEDMYASYTLDSESLITLCNYITREFRVLSFADHKEVYRGIAPSNALFPEKFAEDLLVFRDVAGSSTAIEPLLIKDDKVEVLHHTDGTIFTLSAVSRVKRECDYFVIEPAGGRAQNASPTTDSSNILTTSDPSAYPLSIYHIDTSSGTATLRHYKDPQTGAELKFSSIDLGSNFTLTRMTKETTPEISFIGVTSDGSYVINADKVTRLNERAPAQGLSFYDDKKNFFLSNEEQTALDGVRLSGFPHIHALHESAPDWRDDRPYSIYTSEDGRLCLTTHDATQEIADLKLKRLAAPEEFEPSVKALTVGAESGYIPTELTFIARNYLYHSAASESFAAKYSEMVQDIFAKSLERLTSMPIDEQMKAEAIFLGLQGRMRNKSDLDKDLMTWAKQSAAQLNTCRPLLADRLAGIRRDEEGKIAFAANILRSDEHADGPVAAWRIELASVLSTIQRKDY